MKRMIRVSALAIALLLLCCACASAQPNTLLCEQAEDVNEPLGSFHFRHTYTAGENIKSMKLYIEAWRGGKLQGVFGESVAALTERKGFVEVTATIGGTRWNLMNWDVSTQEGVSHQFSTNLPGDFYVTGLTHAMLGADDQKMIFGITAEEPILLAYAGYQSKDELLKGYRCRDLMEDPSIIDEYEYIYLFKCVFSEKEEAALLS